MEQVNPFIVDGPVPPDSPLYVERDADEVVLNLLLQGEIVHLIGPSGSGKTSLIQRSVKSLSGENVRCVLVNLSELDTAETEDDWYQGLIKVISDSLGVSFVPIKLLKENKIDLVATLETFLSSFIPADRLTILFLDQFEAVERQGFTQPLFEFMVRYNEIGKKAPNLRHISLLISGIKPFSHDDYTKPGRQVQAVRLMDFSLEEASRLGDAFAFDEVMQTEIMRDIFEWTAGHPYLTQRACHEVFKRGRPMPTSIVDSIFHDLSESDPNLNYIRRALTVEDGKLLRDYQRLLLGTSIVNRGALEYFAQIGLIKPDIDKPQIRNRLYREVFNEKWVELKLREAIYNELLFDGPNLTAMVSDFTVAKRYLLKYLRGTGPAGNVYLAEDQNLKGRNVAVRIIPAKYLLPPSRSQAETVEHFEQCLRFAAQLYHKHILDITDFGFIDGQFFFVVMEYAQGENLSAFLRNSGLPGNERTLHILDQIVDAVATAHNSRVLHGDLNPSKLYISNNDGLIVKVGDFGLEKLMNEAPGLPITQPPRPGQVGDPVYMAPEQLVQGDRPWDERADIYSLGLIAYQLFGGELPKFENLSHILRIKREKGYAPLDASPEIQRAIMWALEPEPSHRPASVREWFDALSTAIRKEMEDSESGTAETPEPQLSSDFAIHVVPIVLTSPLAFDREETFTVESVVERATDEVYGQISITPDIDNLPGAVFVGVIRQVMTSRRFKETYERARRESLKTFIYIKRQSDRLLVSNPETLTQDEYDEFKKEMLADGIARYFDTPDEFEETFYNDLTEWLNTEYLPHAITQARGSSAEVITALLDNIRNPDDLDQQLVDQVRRRQVELTGNYWFYFSCAEEDLTDPDIQQFFNDLNAEVRKLAGVNQFYVGAFRRGAAVTSLHTEWFPDTVVALQNSRVLVPLYTPNYFKSEECGKIWEFFQQRAKAAVARKSASPSPISVHIFWSPNESLPSPLPVTVGIQYEPDRVGGRGVRALKHGNRDQYEHFVKQLAQTVQIIGTSYTFPPLAEAPSYSQIQNAFAPAAVETPEPATTDAFQPPRAGRSIFVADSATGEITDEIRITSTELGRELARRGYGLLLHGRTNVDYYVKAAFDEQPVEETSRKGLAKSVHPPPSPDTLSGGTSLLFGSELSYITGLVQQSDAVVVIGGRGGPYDFRAIAEEYGKPVYSFEEFSQPLVEALYTRQLVRRLLNTIDQLWLSPAKPRTETEALDSIVLMQGSLIDQAVDAIVNPIGSDPNNYGSFGRELVEALGAPFAEQIKSQLPLSTGETLVTRSWNDLRAKYVLTTRAVPVIGNQTNESSALAVRSALRKAELLGLETIAFSSIGTDTAKPEPLSLAPAVLRAVLDHLTTGSHLQRVLFAFKNEREYNAYYDTFISLGGRPGYRVLFPYFSEPVLGALRLAEAARIHLGRKHINSNLLLWAITRVDYGPTRELLDSCKTPAEADLALQQRLGITDKATLAHLKPLPSDVLPFLRFSSNADEAFVVAQRLGGKNISERHLLAGVLSVSQSSATRWLSELTGIDAADLYDIVADESKSIADEIASRQTVSIETTAWTLNLSAPQVDGQNLNNVRVGERFTLTLSLEPVALIPGVEPPQNLLRIPVNSLELTGFIRAPGFQLQLELPFSIKLIDGAPEPRTFAFDLKPLLSGTRPIEVELYPGGRVKDLGPTLITRPLTVAPPVVLPNIKELIDLSQIPHPQPDVMLYVALDETPDARQTQMYLTCAALELDREILDPLPLNETDIAELTANVLETAARANDASPSDALAAVRAIGANLFDQLIQGKFRSHFNDIRDLSGITNRRWSWLIISDEKAILPWELVNYYGFDQQSGKIRYDDFLADQFQICHWVGQHGLRLLNSAPMGELDLVHYGQRPELLKDWETALGPELVTTESDAAHMSLLKETSYCFGLHLLRYTEQQRANQIVALQNEPQNERTEGEAITGDQKLDLTLRHPTVGLSLVKDDTAPGCNWCNTELESNWLIPFMQAGASAAYGPRWPVSAEVDQIFVHEFYDTMRQGETLGVAFSKARARVRTSFPHRTDWLAYSYFGHPHAEPYWVQRAQGFTLFEAVNQPAGEIFQRGRSYSFRASYRSEAPASYEGRLHVQEQDISAEDMSVMVVPLAGEEPLLFKLERVPQSNEMQKVFSLTMPLEGNTLPVMVRFQKQTQELRTLFMNLQIGEEG